MPQIFTFWRCLGFAGLCLCKLIDMTKVPYTSLLCLSFAGLRIFAIIEMLFQLAQSLFELTESVIKGPFLCNPGQFTSNGMPHIFTSLTSLSFAGLSLCEIIGVSCEVRQQYPMDCIEMLFQLARSLFELTESVIKGAFSPNPGQFTSNGMRQSQR